MSTISSFSFSDFDPKTGLAALPECGTGLYEDGKEIVAQYDWHAYQDIHDRDAVFIELTGPNADGHEDLTAREAYVRIPLPIWERIITDWCVLQSRGSW